jgi:hypothetical protein
VWGRMASPANDTMVVGDGGDDGGSLGVGELFLEELDLDEWHDFSLGLMTLGSGRGGQPEDAGEGDGHADALLAMAESIGAAPSSISCLCVASSPLRSPLEVTGM